eukprot:scaffold33326_cov242-Isochrysis_galbana.AAC.4
MPSGHSPSPFPFFPIPSPSSGRLLRTDGFRAACSTTDNGMLSVFGSPSESRARAAMRFFPRLKVVLWWWRVEPALSSWLCRNHGFCVRVSSSEVCSGRQLPVSPQAPALVAVTD